MVYSPSPNLRMSAVRTGIRNSKVKRTEMTELNAANEPLDGEGHGIPLVAIATVLVRWRRLIVALGIIGAALGLTGGLLSTRVYSTTATFIPQGSESVTSGLGIAASQFGIRLPSSGGGSSWGPPIYVQVLRSRGLLERIAFDTVEVTERNGERIALMDLLNIKAPSVERRADLATQKLGLMVVVNEVPTLNAVKLTVTTAWPSVSLAIAQALLRGVNQFNLETRKSQATAERKFIEGQVAEAERALREAEDRLQEFLQRNRAIAGSPELGFERDRLQREATLRQQIYTTLLQNREEARSREVRDTPVITILEEPRLPLNSESRKSAQRAILGGLAGGMIATLIAFAANGFAEAKRTPTRSLGESLSVVHEATPHFLRRSGR